MVIDYKKLNKKTIINYPIPNKVLLINKLKGQRYFSKFDCKNGFFSFKNIRTR